MCNNFNSFQIICLFSPTQTYGQLPCKGRSFHTAFMLENAGFMHILIFEYLKMFPLQFPLSKYADTMNQKGNWL